MAQNKIDLRKEQVELIEELAHAHEQLGLQPAWAKILALLTVSDQTELTFDQIMDTLSLSKSAVSQALKQLEITKRVGYKNRIGERKRYFFLVFSDWNSQMIDFFGAMGNIIGINKKIIAVRTPETVEFNRNLVARNEFLSLVYNKAMESIGK